MPKQFAKPLKRPRQELESHRREQEKLMQKSHLMTGSLIHKLEKEMKHQFARICEPSTVVEARQRAQELNSLMSFTATLIEKHLDIREELQHNVGKKGFCCYFVLSFTYFCV
jgi:hypothetical protein